MSDIPMHWIDKNGEPFADYEISMIEGNKVEDVALYLGFQGEHFDTRYTQAFHCHTCGVLITNRAPYLRQHRISCGWFTP